MAKTKTSDSNLRKGAKVVATTELRDVPEGTKGRVTIVNGVRWIRYWVRFDNGVTLGSIDRSALATPSELLNGTGPATASAAADDGAGAAEADAADAGGKATPSGTMVPQKLLDRAAAARIRLAA